MATFHSGSKDHIGGSTMVSLKKTGNTIHSIPGSWNLQRQTWRFLYAFWRIIIYDWTFIYPHGKAFLNFLFWESWIYISFPQISRTLYFKRGKAFLFFFGTWTANWPLNDFPTDPLRPLLSLADPCLPISHVLMHKLISYFKAHCTSQVCFSAITLSTIR